ncbi:putative Lysyl-tRNA synthetase [Zychaea mexicana]|uniref:putative Lysyl-tRNA synthetase n=1 Tax=Zychaea mexicana TaxID=64656 RepID=UPI0022FDD7AE|nr:putative Lysyl-tRNA synthetase [Zychaea mexicana]KAI9488425.1 putative Lysyl-tRNA synthetase [Zychaea mexicana]
MVLRVAGSSLRRLPTTTATTRLKPFTRNRALFSTTARTLKQQEPEYGTIDPKRLQYPRFALDRERHGSWSTVQDIRQKTQLLDNGQKADDTIVTLTGRIHSKRESSAKLVFYDVIQNGELIQVVASKGRYEGDSFAEANHALCRGDIASFTGVPGKTNRGQAGVFVTREMRVLTPCLQDIPRAGLKDPEKRFRQRHLDMLVNPHVTKTLRIRAEIIKYIRRFLEDRGFLEVETPVLADKAGGANARPFMTRAHALSMDMQLRIAPELYLKQLVIGGMDRVYEVGKQFRNEGIDADHNPEFTTCEFYQAYGNLDSLMNDTEDMLRGLTQEVNNKHGLPDSVNFDKSFKRIHVLDRLESLLQLPVADLLKTEDATDQLVAACRQHRVALSGPLTIPRILDKLISHFIEPECTQPTFLYSHPVALSPLAKGYTDDKGRAVAARFELFVGGKEIVNAYEELNDPNEQRIRFEQQMQERQQGDIEAPLPDTAFCDALEYGLPPTAGWGMGIDRVVQILTGSSHIREVLAFPVMRPVTFTENIK